MSIKRTQVGATEVYAGRRITVSYMGPDFLCHVDEIELSGFYVSPNAAVSAGQRYIDDERKSREKKQ